MKTFQLIISLLIAFLVFSGFSKGEFSGVIKGIVLDAKSLSQLEGANVLISQSGRGTITDAGGNFTFTGLQPGVYTIQVFYLGFARSEIEVEVAHETVDLKILLKKQNINLKEVVIKPSYENNINIIHAIDMNNHPVKSSQDLLKIVPGLSIAQHAGGGKSEQMFMRGFDLDHGTDISITADGIPVNMVSHAHGQGYADLHFLIPETVERINTNKGPHNAKDGDFATSGAVHFHTKNKIDNNLVKLEVGMFSSYRSLFMVDILKKERKEKESLFIAGEYKSDDGYFESPQGLLRGNLFFKYYNKFSNNSIFSASISTFSSKWNASGQIPARSVQSGEITRYGAIDNFEGGNTSRHNVKLQWLNILPAKSSLRHDLYFSNYDFKLFSNFTFFLEDSINGDRIKQSEKRNIYGYTISHTRLHKLFNLEFKLNAGAGFRYDDIDELTLANIYNKEDIRNNKSLGDADQLNYFSYLSESIQLTSSLSLYAAIRLEKYSFQYKDFLNDKNVYNKSEVVADPKLSVYYQLNKHSTFFVKSSYGHHSNDIRSIMEGSDKKILPKAFAVDLGSEFKLAEKYLFSVTLWSLSLEQELVYVGDEAVVEEIGATDRKGIELSARLPLSRIISLDADFNYSHARAVENKEEENFIPLAPVFTGSGGISFRELKGFYGSFRYRWMADRPANEDNSLIASGYFLCDLVCNYSINKLEFGVVIENIFNREWKEAQFETTSRLRGEVVPVTEIHFTPGSPRFIKGTVSYVF